MKTFLQLVTIVLSCTPALAQYNIQWGPEITVADGATYGNTRPRITLTSNDSPLVLLGEHSDGALYIAKGNGTSFDLPVSIVPSGMETYLANWTGPDIAAHGDTVVAVFKAMPFASGNIYAVRSTDGGVTFSDTLRVDNHDAGRSWMPALDMDNQGNPTVTYMIFDGSGGNERICVVRSIDAGSSYLGQQIISTGTAGHACDCCPPEMVIEGQRQVALFRNNVSNIRDSWGILSEDNGVNFTSDIDLDELDWFITQCPATGAHGTIIGDSIYVVSASEASGKYLTYLSTASVNGGLTLGSVKEFPSPGTAISETQNYPRITGANDTLISVWVEGVSGSPEVMCAVAIDGNSSTLTAFKARANETTASLQRNPDVIYKNGYVHLVYEDHSSGNVLYRRGIIADVTGLETINTIEFSVYPNPSTDGLFTWQTDTELTDIQVMDLNGKVVKAKIDSVAQTIDGSQLQSGHYLLQVKSDNGSAIKELVITR